MLKELSTVRTWGLFEGSSTVLLLNEKFSLNISHNTAKKKYTVCCHQVFRPANKSLSQTTKRDLSPTLNQLKKAVQNIPKQSRTVLPKKNDWKKWVSAAREFYDSEFPQLNS